MFSADGVAASFLYNGAYVELNPSEMPETAPGVFEKQTPDGLTAILSFEKIEEDAFTQLLRFENRGEKNSGVISAIRSFDRRLPAPGGTTYESLFGDDCGAFSFAPRKGTLFEGDCLGVEPKFGRPSDTWAFPFFDIEAGDGAFTFGIGWSGQWVLELAAEAGTLRVAAGLSETKTFLYPGESIRTASMFWVKAADIPAARRKFRRLMLDRFAPRDPKTGGYAVLPIAETNFDRYFRKRADWDTAAGQKRCADVAAACHMDTLWLDAAWFREGFPGGVGNNDFAPGFPNGTGEVSAYAHKKGLRYVQWFEPERANAYSDTVRYHRDDVIILEGHNSVNCLVNIGDEQVRRRVTDEIKTHIREDGIDIYRQDFNICPSGYWRTADAPGRRGMTEIRFVEGHYAMWDEIRAEFPEVLIDNCASGGRRLDFETCRRAVPLWRSDTGCSDETDDRRASVWSQNQILGLTRYLPYHSSGCWRSEAYFVRSAAAGGVAMNLDVFADDFDPAAVIPIVEETRRLRAYWAGDFYPLTAPTNAEDVFAAWQLSLGDRGAVYAFRRKDCPQSVFTAALSAIDPNKTYRVAVTDEHMNVTEKILPGRALVSLTLTLDEKRSSLVAEYGPADDGRTFH